MTGSLRGKALRGIGASMTVPFPSPGRNPSLQPIIEPTSIQKPRAECIVHSMQAVMIQGSVHPVARVREPGFGSGSVAVAVAVVGRHQRSAPRRRSVVRVESFGILKQLGLQKPGWLPDFGKSRRKMLIERFFGPIDRATYEDLLADDFVMRDEQDSTATFTRQDWIRFMCERVHPAIPDYTWTPATDGAVAADGYAVVELEPAGHHVGGTFDLGSEYSPIPPSGQRFKLPPSMKRVKVENGKIKEIIAMRGHGAEVGPVVLYNALAKVPRVDGTAIQEKR